MQANDDEENANQVLRSAAMAFANLKDAAGRVSRPYGGQYGQRADRHE